MISHISSRKNRFLDRVSKILMWGGILIIVGWALGKSLGWIPSPP